MPVSVAEYRRVALADPSARWELHCGELSRETGMTHPHGDISSEVGFVLRSQLDPAEYRVRYGHSRTRVDSERYYVPDIAVVPTAYTAPFFGSDDVLEEYDQPLPLIVEVWSPSTGAFDLTQKVPDYQRRGDAEIWLIHPYERWLRAWTRDGSGVYTERLYQSGTVRCSALAGVEFDLDALFRNYGPRD